MKGIIKYYKLENYLKKGGDPNAYSSEGESLLSIHHCYPRHAKLLLDNGADPNQSFYNNILVEPISYACESGNIKFAKLLLEYNVRDLTRGLYFSIKRHNCELISLLLKNGANINTKYGPYSHSHSLLDYYVIHFDITYDIPSLKSILSYKPILSKEDRIILKHYTPEIYSEFIRRKWTPIRCAVKFLGLHQRAVVSANHPLRKLERGEFKEEVYCSLPPRQHI
jgi:hypothetical protein